MVEETIRMVNIAPVVFGQANKDVDGQGDQKIRYINLWITESLIRVSTFRIAGYRIPKDWQVVVWLRHLHTDPDNFPVPFHFNPDRWNVS